MVDFDKLNRETNAYNARNVSREPSKANANPKYGTSTYWQNYWNNQIYKTNNGEYSRHY